MDIKGNITAESEKTVLDSYQTACAKGHGPILLHFEETASVNGSGIAVLIQLLGESKKQGRPVGVTGISENFAKIFDMVGITRFTTVYENEATALTNLTLAATDSTETEKS